MTGKFEVKDGRKDIVDLDELVGLLSYVMEGIELAPQREVPWGGISRLVKDINRRTTKLREGIELSPGSNAAAQPSVKANTVAMVAAPPPVQPSPMPTQSAPSQPIHVSRAEPIDEERAAETILETEVDSSLQSSPLARRIQMAPRVGSGRVREVNVSTPVQPSPGAR